MMNVAIFPGQGSQAPGMGKSLYETSVAAKASLDACDTAYGGGLLDICFNGTSDDLKDTAVAQPALFSVSVAAFAAAHERGYVADAVAGHSVGEYAALCVAGVFDIETGLRLVKARGKAMAAAAATNPGGMAAVLGLDAEVIAKCCAESGLAVVAANDNCPGQVVISGVSDAIDAITQPLKDIGAKKVIRLAVSGGFHSPLMLTAAKEMETVLLATTFTAPRIRVVANVTADWISDPDAIKAALVEQVAGTVRWTETLRLLSQAGSVCFTEFGSGNVLAGLVKRTLPDVGVQSVGDSNGLVALFGGTS
ncbi:MAG: ACP S-malonyltransferase [Armatimonadota bacterium]